MRARRPNRLAWSAALALLTVAKSVSANEGQAPQPAMTERVRACTACHGDQGRAGPDGYYPRLAGKPAGYLYQQLQHFAEGRRQHEPMRRLLATLDDSTLRQFSEYFSGIRVGYPPPLTRRTDAAQLARGRTLALEGERTSGLPACADCHGPRLTGVEPNTPGLLGLPVDYLNAQLGAWRSGLRQAHAPDCMADIARRLDAYDVNAVTRWLAAQPVPEDGRPTLVATRVGADSLRCGTDRADRPAEAVGSSRLEPGTAKAAAPAPNHAPDAVTRGAYLARAGNCVACHTVRGRPLMSGARPIETPFGAVYSSNLTPDTDSGLGLWTPDDFWNALHHGRSRNGRLLAPAFPYEHTTRIRREDSDAIFAWLRSLPGTYSPQPEHRLTWPLGTQPALAIWRMLFFRPNPFTPDSTRDAQWNRGAYLVEALGHCAACHAPRNVLGAIRSVDDLSGGRMPVVGWYAPSLIDDTQTGLASTPLEQSMLLLKTGLASHASASGPMAEVVQQGLQFLSDEDLRGITAYLKSRAQAGPIRPVKPALPPPSTAARGGPVYRQHCSDCHGENGEGRPGLSPALRGNRAVLLADPSNVVLAVLHGGYSPVTAGNRAPAGMPPFLLELDDQQLADVTSWIRTGLQRGGRTASSVSASEVSQIRDRSRW